MVQPSVIVVDDDANQLALFKMTLRHLPCIVTTADSGEQALKLLRNQSPDLMILDVFMPRMSGLELLHTIRADARFAGIKIIVMTVVPQLVSAEDAALCDLLLTKPIDIHELGQVIRQFLNI